MVQYSNVPVTTTAPVKPGVKTTEFYLTVAAVAVSAVMAFQGAFNATPGTLVLKAAAGLGAVLAVLGYQQSRATVKAAAIDSITVQ